MKNIIIFDCGPSISEVSDMYGSSPEWIQNILSDVGCKFLWVKSYAGDKVGNDMGDAWIITGSPRSVYEEKDWMLNLESKIRYSEENHIPVLGICFGHQLIAKSLGGIVDLNPNGWELGSYPIELTAEGLKSSILYGIQNNDIVYQSHQDCVVTLPQRAKKLAFNSKGIQAFSINDYIYGVQFHPEFSYDIIRKYVQVRMNKGIKVDNPLVTESNAGVNVLLNFIKKIL